MIIMMKNSLFNFKHKLIEMNKLINKSTIFIYLFIYIYLSILKIIYIFFYVLFIKKTSINNLNISFLNKVFVFNLFSYLYIFYRSIIILIHIKQK